MLSFIISGLAFVTTPNTTDLNQNLKLKKNTSSDMIHTYWLKKLTALHEHLAVEMHHLLSYGTHPGWFT